MKTRGCTFFVAFLLCVQAVGDEFKGRCIFVLEGDKIVVDRDDRKVIVSVWGIATPKGGLDQPFGREAKAFTEKAALGKVVTVKQDRVVRMLGKGVSFRSGGTQWGSAGSDRLGDVILPDGTDLGGGLVENGLAWWCINGDERLEALEGKARAAKSGLWAGPDAVPPWDWQNKKGFQAPHAPGQFTSQAAADRAEEIWQENQDTAEARRRNSRISFDDNGQARNGGGGPSGRGWTAADIRQERMGLGQKTALPGRSILGDLAAASQRASEQAENDKMALRGARLSRYCLVSYEREGGWSEANMMLVEFVSGQGLNKATMTFDYDILGTYAELWFAQGQVAIVKLEGTVFVTGESFTNEDFKRLFLVAQEVQGRQVNGDVGRRWKLRAKDQFFRWIDNRAGE